jgi:hypothetical protein
VHDTTLPRLAAGRWTAWRIVARELEGGAPSVDFIFTQIIKLFNYLKIL